MIKNFSLLDDSQIQECLNNKSVKIGIIGIGRIGLPTALSFANSGFNTVGIDINKKLVDMVNTGNYPLKDEPEFDKIFENVYNNKKITATTDISEVIPDCDVIILSLPTPMDDQNIPDYSALRTVATKLSETLSPNSLVIVESTIEPGFIEDEMVSIICKTGRLEAGKNFFIGVCPENANPGEILHDFTNLPRLVGGINQNVTKIIKLIYEFVFCVELIDMPNCKTANAVKLTTNVFRDVNIAFVNELSLLFEKLGIDTMTVLKAAQSKYNFQVHYPGSGVGGPCLPINSYQLLNTARRTNSNLSIIESGRKINEKMPEHVINLTLDGFQECNQNIKEATILILGISYKPNVKDIQLTPAEIIIKKLQKLGVTVCIYDPYFKDVDVFGIKSEKNLDDIIPNVNAAIIVTGHDEFKKLELSKFSQMKNRILIDTRGIIEPNSAKNENLIFRGLGRG